MSARSSPWFFARKNQFPGRISTEGFAQWTAAIRQLEAKYASQWLVEFWKHNFGVRTLSGKLWYPRSWGLHDPTYQRTEKLISLSRAAKSLAVDALLSEAC